MLPFVGASFVQFAMADGVGGCMLLEAKDHEFKVFCQSRRIRKSIGKFEAERDSLELRRVLWCGVHCGG